MLLRGLLPPDTYPYLRGRHRSNRGPILNEVPHASHRSCASLATPRAPRSTAMRRGERHLLLPPPSLPADPEGAAGRRVTRRAVSRRREDRRRRCRYRSRRVLAVSRIKEAALGPVGGSHAQTTKKPRSPSSSRFSGCGENEKGLKGGVCPVPLGGRDAVVPKVRRVYTKVRGEAHPSDQVLSEVIGISSYSQTDE